MSVHEHPSRAIALVGFSALMLSFASPARATLPSQESRDDYFRKWLREDVLYIITPEEVDVFMGLSTDPERELFIEQFWRRRDSDPQTSFNEFKEEHYRRIAYANENFTSGFPGWKTDRGMIYIKFGEPDRRETHPTGGHYVRPSREGGGSTSTYPYERWEYRFLEGIGQDIEIEFVDPGLTGEYRLAGHADEKDALLLTPNAGLTEAEMLGLVSQKIDRIVRKTSPMPGHQPLLFGAGRARDQPFEKLRLVTGLEKVPAVDFSDLRTQVLARAHFDELPVEMRSDVFRAGDEGRVVLTWYLSEGDLEFQFVHGIYREELDLQVVVKDRSGQTVRVSEDSLRADRSEADYRSGSQQQIVHQQNLLLPPGRYKVEVFVRERSSGKMGFSEGLIVIPRTSRGELSVSSVMLARRIEVIGGQEGTKGSETFRVWPVPGASVSSEENKLGFYFEIYGFQVDSSSGKPSLDLHYEILDFQGNSWPGEPEFHSTEVGTGKIMILSILKTGHLSAGSHRLKIHLHDRISNRKLAQSVEFVRE